MINSIPMLRKPKPIPKPLILLLMASLLFLIPILLLFFLLNFSSSSSSPQLLETACKSTLFPPTCESTLSRSSSLPPNPTPPDLIQSLLSSSLQNTQTALSLSHSILNLSLSIPARANAAQNCIRHLTLSSLRLSALNKDATFTDIPSTRAFVGAALLYQYDCWSALKYVNGTRQVAEAMSFVTSLARITSSALAMLVAVQRFGADADVSSWSPPQTERDGYWPDGSDNDDDYAVRFPDGLSVDVTVCKGGNCDYETVQEAVNAAPDFGSKRFVIGIAAGVYEENVEVPFEKTNVVFVGDGMGRTVITGKLNAQMVGVTTFNTATVGVFGDGFMARDLTFENTAGPGSHQAVAFRCDSDRSFLYLVEFTGHQDTLYARSLRQLYVNCTISGTVDFIFGNSAAVFKNCLVVVVPRQESPEKGERNAVTAHGRTDPGQATGFVFKDCIVGGSQEYMKFYKMRPTRHRVYLGRPWKQYSRTVFLDCYLAEMVQPEGWMPFRAGLGLETLFYGEYGSSGPGANVSGRVKWSNQVPKEHLGVYSMRNFLQGDVWVLRNQ